jgi:uncharacterized protein DUF402
VRPVPYGAQVLLRYRYPDGRLQAALPMRVVEDRTDRLVAWLAPQTEIMYWALTDGRDPRVVPLGERFRMPLTTAARRWQGTGVLRVIPVQSTYQVLHFWDDDGSFSGWYVNFEAPKTRRGTRLDTVDWHLDLWIDAAGVATWKDEDEAQAAVEAGHLSERNLELAWRTGRQIIEGFSDWRDVVGDWRSFRPPAAWLALGLPSDWAD